MRHLLHTLNTSSTTTTQSSTSTSSDSPTSTAPTVDSDFVVILAALLCALICVLGLVAVARCAWIRRLSGVSPPLPPANKGLKKKVLKSLPKVSYSVEDTKGTTTDESCAICLSEFASGEEIRVLPHCRHAFHVSCIDTWLGSHSSCPSCRQILVAPTRCHNCGAHAPTPSNNNQEQQQQQHNHHHQHSTVAVSNFLP